MRTIHETYSLCPECVDRIKAKIKLDYDGTLWIVKKCKKHGTFKDKYFEYGLYKKFMRYLYDGVKTSNIDDEGENCPLDCGLCKRHKSHTALANIAVTSRCILQCNYCFFYTSDFWKKRVYEPSIEKIREMLEILASQKPIRCNAVQYTGGEPLLREDIVDIVKLTKSMGFEQIQMNTTGIPLIQKKGLAEKLIDVTTYYLSFDGVSPQKNPKNHFEIPYIFKELRKTNANVVLVPTIIKNINDDEVGKIVNFGINHRDIVKAINFQPVSLVGRLTKKEVEKYRITIPDLIEKLEEQTNGVISKEDFYPVPCIGSISRFVDSLTGCPSYHFSAHPVCGTGTYIFIDKERVIPITRFFDVEGFFEYLDNLSNEIEKEKLLKGIKRKEAILKLILTIGKFLDKEKAPKEISLEKILIDIFLKKDYNSVGVFHMKTIMIGMMHFQDLYNYDIERVERCCIHYVTDDGNIVPFCAYNVLPEIYRDKIMRKYSMPKGKQPFYVRNVEKLKSSEIYRNTYNLRNYFGEEMKVEIYED